VDELEPGNVLPQRQHADLPVRRVTVNSIVALNLAYFRKAAGLTQEELGERIGWGKSVVSTAERSWDAQRVRSFSAEDLMAIAAALQIPLAALFLPPEDDGTAFSYVLDMPGPEEREPDDLLAYVFPTYGGDSPVMNAYRKRLITAGVLDPDLTDNLVTAGDLLENVQRLSDEVLEEARHEAVKALENARGDSRQVLAKAIHQAEQITADARVRAEALERDARERHRQAMGSLVPTREELERRIDDLRTYEREYRSRLRAYIEGQLLDFLSPESREQAERMVEEVRKRAVAGEGLGVSAVLLREDGTYGVLQFPSASADHAETEESPGAGEDDRQ
jgi:transcriptional regulator with XRE-family HTH domain